MALSEDAVREELKQVVDPELFVNIVDLGLVYAVDFQPGGADAQEQNVPEEGAQAEGAQEESAQADDVEPKTNVKIEMTLTSPACPAGPQLIEQSRQVLSRMEGVGDVEIKLVMDPPWTPDRMTDDAKDQLGIF